VRDVGLGPCDASCQHCFWVFSFSVTEVQPGDCRSIPDGFRAHVPLKAKSRGLEGSGGRGLGLGIAGRTCEASVGQKAVQEQAPLGGSREGISL